MRRRRETRSRFSVKAYSTALILRVLAVKDGYVGLTETAFTCLISRLRFGAFLCKPPWHAWPHVIRLVCKVGC